MMRPPTDCYLMHNLYYNMSDTGSEDSGGYECHVVDEDHDLSCPICLMILKEPHLMSCCGVKTCSICMKSIKEGSKPECPWCRENDFTTMLDKSTMRQVLNLEVYCNNKQETGCDWTGELRNLEDHLKSCFVYVQCKYSCGYQCHVKKSDELIQHEMNQCDMRPEVLLTKEVFILKDKVTSLEEECEKKKNEIQEYEKLVEKEQKDHREEMNKLKKEIEDMTINLEEKDKELNKCRKVLERERKNRQHELTKEEKDGFEKEINRLNIQLQECTKELMELKGNTNKDSNSEDESDDDKRKTYSPPLRNSRKVEDDIEEDTDDVCTKCKKGKVYSDLSLCKSCIECPSCRQPLKNYDSIISTTDGHYHQRCFYCYNCHKVDDIVAETSSGLVCKTCLDQYFAT